MKRKFNILFIVLLLIHSMIPAAASAAQEEPSVLEAPQNVIVELKQYEDGKPYFEVKWTNPASILELVQYWDNNGEAPLEYQIDMRVGNGSWLYDRGESLQGNSLHAGDDETGIFAIEKASYDPINKGLLDTVDIKSNVYSFRLRYAYLIPNDEEQHYTYGPFSNTVSIGVDTYYKDASSWAKPELQEAYDAGLIPDILKGADMTRPITREEFAELALLLHEKSTGRQAAPYSPNPFTDTVNPQVLKAYALGITTGTSKTTFSPNVLINREQCATMLYRTIKSIAPDSEHSISGVKDFPDQKDISSWAVEGTKFLFKLGVIKGDSNGNFMPKAVTSAQEATGYGMATREAAILMTVRTSKKLPDISAESTSGKIESTPETAASPAQNLNSLIGKATGIDTGYFEATSEVAGQTVEIKCWKKGSMVKKVQTGSSDGKTKTDIFDMSEGVAYSYFEDSTEAVRTVYTMSDPSKLINPFNFIDPINLGAMQGSADTKITGNETIDGASCAVITTTIDGETHTRIWVSEDGLKRRSETIYFGFPVTTLYKNYKIGGSISDSEFELPTGVTVDDDVSVTITD